MFTLLHDVSRACVCLRAGDSIVVQRPPDVAAAPPPAPPAPNEYPDSDQTPDPDRSTMSSVRHLIHQLQGKSFKTDYHPKAISPLPDPELEETFEM